MTSHTPALEARGLVKRYPKSRRWRDMLRGKPREQAVIELLLQVGQARDVLALVFKKNNVFFERWRAVQLYQFPEWARSSETSVRRPLRSWRSASTWAWKV